MKSLVLLALLALLTLGLCRRGMGESRADGDTGGGSVPSEGLCRQQKDWENFAELWAEGLQRGDTDRDWGCQ